MRLKITAIEPVTERISLFTLVMADGSDLPPYDAGAHLDFDLGDVGTRSYSLVDFVPLLGAPETYKIAVQREPGGDGGSLAMHGLSVGDHIQTTEPKNSFELHNGNAPALLIAGGIGVTPIISFATELTRRGAEFAFHYATRSPDVCAFGDQLAAQHGDALTRWYDDTNPIDLGALIAAAPKNAQVFCCGPMGMIEAVKTAAEAAGFGGDQVHFELFTTPDAQDSDKPFEVEISSTGQVFTIPADKTIIDVLEDAGVDVMFDCQRGDCGICQTDVIDGVPDHRDVVLSQAERDSGKIMQICVSRAKSARLVLDI